jgi:hypothetical protein
MQQAQAQPPPQPQAQPQPQPQPQAQVIVPRDDLGERALENVARHMFANDAMADKQIKTCRSQGSALIKALLARIYFPTNADDARGAINMLKIITNNQQIDMDTVTMGQVRHLMEIICLGTPQAPASQDAREKFTSAYRIFRNKDRDDSMNYISRIYSARIDRILQQSQLFVFSSLFRAHKIERMLDTNWLKQANWFQHAPDDAWLYNFEGTNVANTCPPYLYPLYHAQKYYNHTVGAFWTDQYIELINKTTGMTVAEHALIPFIFFSSITPQQLLTVFAGVIAGAGDQAIQMQTWDGEMNETSRNDQTRVNNNLWVCVDTANQTWRPYQILLKPDFGYFPIDIRNYQFPQGTAFNHWQDLEFVWCYKFYGPVMLNQMRNRSLSITTTGRQVAMCSKSSTQDDRTFALPHWGGIHRNPVVMRVFSQARWREVQRLDSHDIIHKRPPTQADAHQVLQYIVAFVQHLRDVLFFPGIRETERMYALGNIVNVSFGQYADILINLQQQFAEILALTIGAESWNGAVPLPQNPPLLQQEAYNRRIPLWYAEMDFQQPQTWPQEITNLKEKRLQDTKELLLSMIIYIYLFARLFGRLMGLRNTTPPPQNPPQNPPPPPGDQYRIWQDRVYADIRDHINGLGNRMIIDQQNPGGWDDPDDISPVFQNSMLRDVNQHHEIELIEPDAQNTPVTGVPNMGAVNNAQPKYMNSLQRLYEAGALIQWKNHVLRLARDSFL